MLLTSHQRDDQGQALVMVIGMMLVMALVITVIVSSTMFGLGSTSQTRASVQATAAAEAGIDVIGAAIQNEECASIVTGAGVVDQSDGTPAFDGLVYYQESSTAGFFLGCPDAGHYAYKVVSTGFAEKPGAMGHDSGDTETLEAVWVRSESPPRFEDAVYGHSFVGTRGMAGIFSEEGDASVFTAGDFECPAAMVIEGSVVVEGNATWSSVPCRVDGNVYVGGSLAFSNDSTASPNVGGDLFVKGNLTTNLSKGHGSFVTGLDSDSRALGVEGAIRVEGLIDAYCAYGGAAPNSNWDGFNVTGSASDLADCASGSDTRVQMRVADLSTGPTKDFIVLTPESEPFGSWTEVPWQEPGTGRYVSGNVCDHAGWGEDPAYPGADGSAAFTVTENTVIDTTATCSSEVKLGDWGGLTINLEADLAILANSFVRNGNVTINSVDGEKHSLYLIDPLPSGTLETWTCPTPTPSVGPSGGIDITGGQPWIQDSQVAVMMYTHGQIDAHSSIDFGGQVYGCRADLVSGFSMTYRPVGDATPSDGLASFAIEYLRRSP